MFLTLELYNGIGNIKALEAESAKYIKCSCYAVSVIKWSGQLCDLLIRFISHSLIIQKIDAITELLHLSADQSSCRQQVGRIADCIAFGLNTLYSKWKHI